MKEQILRHALSFIALVVMSLPVHSTEAPSVGPDEGDMMDEASDKAKDVQPDWTAKLEAEAAVDLEILGETIAPGEHRKMLWRSPQSFGGFVSPAPLHVINGERPGPVLCFTAALHGDEINGIEISRRVLHELEAKALRGTVVILPIVNFEGFLRLDRHIGNRWDLNRFFPGDAKGSYPSRVAHALFHDVIVKCDALVDMHTGSYYGENLPQIRGDLSHSGVAKLARGFGGLSVVHDSGPPGSLRGAATQAGVPAVALEIGVALKINVEQVEQGVDGILTLLRRVGMLGRGLRLLEPKASFFHIEWVRSNTSGILINHADLGDRVTKGQKLAEIIDPILSETEDVLAPLNGQVLGRAENQFVSPGFALFRIGVEKTLEEMEAKAEAEAEQSESDDEPKAVPDPEFEQN